MTFRREKRNGGLKAVEVHLKELDGLNAKVGWFETARYPDGTSVAYVATIQEFGSGKIPPRPFMRPAIRDHGKEWIDGLANGARAVVKGDATAENVLEAVALVAAGNVAEKIAAVTTPKLADATIANRQRRSASGKASTKPLVDTGQMIGSVTGKVERS